MTFARIDQRPISNTDCNVWLVCPVRDEQAILPDFLRHYRSIGIEKFCFIDNGSVDGTKDYLLAQTDCIVFHTDESYRASSFAANWVNRVIAELRIAGWLVLADADEHLCYSGMEHQSIKALLDKCMMQGADALYGVMVDMYPSGGFMDVRVNPGDRLGQLMPYFDSDYLFRRWPRPPWKDRRGHLQVLGGPRCRLLVTLDAERRRSWIFSTAVNQVDRFVNYVPQNLMPWLARMWPREVPAQIKTPVNFVRPGFRFSNSHTSTNLRFSSELVSLLHYKFCSELQARLKMAENEGNHFRRGLSYLQLRQALHDWNNSSLMYNGTRRFSSSRDLDDVGLTGTHAAMVWESGFTKEFRTSSRHGREEVRMNTSSTSPDRGSRASVISTV